MGWVWNDERVEYLKKLWCGEGLSGTICAHRLSVRYGGDLSRSAVISKVSRMREWPRRKQAISHEVTRKRQPRLRPLRGNSPFAPWQPGMKMPKHDTNNDRAGLKVKRQEKQASIIKALLRDPSQLQAPVDAVRHTCVTLPADQCKWIYGDPRESQGALFCSAKRFVDASGHRWPYCAHHCTIAHPSMQEAAEACGCDASGKEDAHV